MTAAKDNRFTLSLSNWAHLLVCMALLGVALVTLLRPALDQVAADRMALQGLQSRLAEHKALLALHGEIAGALAESSEGARQEAVDPASLARGDFGDFQTRLHQFADKCDLSLAQATPRVMSVGERRLLGVALVATGPFSGMRAFVEGVLQLPELFHFESLTLSQDGDDEQLAATIWFRAE